VTIRKTLLVAFLAVSLIPAILLSMLAFSTAGEAMRQEIGRSLLVQSATVSEDIDKMLFERLQNAQTWRRLEVMQDIQVNDVDKRLAKFLTDLKTGYRDVYHELSCINPDGRIVASSNAALIGKQVAPADTLLQIEPNIAVESLDLSDSEGTFTIRAGIDAQFKEGSAGELLLRFNWGQIYRILDQAAQNGRMVMLVDRQNRIVAASSQLRNRGMLLTELPNDWLPVNKKNGKAILDGAPLNMSEVTVGFDRSHGFQHFPGFGWTTLVIQPSHQAFLPIQKMATMFLILLILVISFAIGLSLLVAGRIAQPIADLTAFTRRFMHDKKLPTSPVNVGGEVGELTAAFVQTVHDLDQSQQHLVRASKLAVLGEMAAVMAHEVRTPLGILRSSAQMLAREELSPEARELTGFIESETQRLNSLVSTLLDTARPRPPNFQPTDIQGLIKHSVGLLAGQAEKKNIALETHCDSEATLLVNGDAEQLTQVLLNLILNALQILPVGGRVSVCCKSSHGKLTVAIADNGPGIPPEDQPRVFDPFFTRREGGVGLGLAVVQQIVVSHGGEISAGTSEMGGALFTITLPIKEIE
jgi:signal transduction histidine kinase